MTKIERNNDFTMREQISTALTDLETDVAALQSNAGYALFVQSPEFDPADSAT